MASTGSAFCGSFDDMSNVLIYTFNAAYYNSHVKTDYEKFIEHCHEKKVSFMLLQEWPCDAEMSLNVQLSQHGFGVVTAPEHGLCIAYDNKRYMPFEYVQCWTSLGKCPNEKPSYSVIGTSSAMCVIFKETKDCNMLWGMTNVDLGKVFDQRASCLFKHRVCAWIRQEQKVKGLVCNINVIGGGFRDVHDMAYRLLSEMGYQASDCDTKTDGSRGRTTDLLGVFDSSKVRNISMAEETNYGSDHNTILGQLEIPPN